MLFWSSQMSWAPVEKKGFVPSDGFAALFAHVLFVRHHVEIIAWKSNREHSIQSISLLSFHKAHKWKATVEEHTFSLYIATDAG